MAATPSDTQPAAPELDAATQKWLTYNTNRTSKIDRLAEENSKLKSEIARLKSSNSRIRRIPPKKTAEVEPTSQ